MRRRNKFDTILTVVDHLMWAAWNSLLLLALLVPFTAGMWYR